MKIVTVCKEGNNRSVTFAHLLKYKYKADVLAIGTNSCSVETQGMLFTWAEYIIVTDERLLELIPKAYTHKCKVWNVGADTYPRPFHPELLEKAKKFIKDNPL